MKKILMIGLLSSTVLTHAMAGGLGAFWAFTDTKDAGESNGYGAKLQLGKSNELKLEARISFFDDFEENIDLQYVPIELGLLLDLGFNDAVKPYLGGGAGFYMLEAETLEMDGSVSEVDLDDEFGWYIVGGLSGTITENLDLFGEVMYRSVEGTVTHDGFDDVDIDAGTINEDLSGIGYAVGLMLTW